MTKTLISLPLELRQLIYEFLFSSYTIRHGFGRASSSNRTALFLTCRQIHTEAWRFLPLNAQFHFRGTETMLDSLLSVDMSVITRIRHIHVKAFPFPLYATGRVDYYTTYYFSNALSLFPGLHLDCLVVEDCFHGPGLLDGWRDIVTYFDIEALLNCDGWKELHYISPTTDFLTSLHDHRRKRVAQPENWNSLLQQRDGEASGAEVQMYITPRGTSNDPSGEVRAMQPWSAKPGTELLDAGVLDPMPEVEGEVRVVARRGRGARYVQTGLAQKSSWKELKDQGIVRDDWKPYHNDMADAVGWIYGGWGRRLQLAVNALG